MKTYEVDPLKCKREVCGNNRDSMPRQCNRKAVNDEFCAYHHPDNCRARAKAEHDRIMNSNAGKLVALVCHEENARIGAYIRTNQPDFFRDILKALTASNNPLTNP